MFGQRPAKRAAHVGAHPPGNRSGVGAAGACPGREPLDERGGGGTCLPRMMLVFMALASGSLLMEAVAVERA